jgi:hypothetical protein
VHVWELDLTPEQVQDLADAMGELLTASVGLELRFRLRLELSGVAGSDHSLVDRVGSILKNIT